jgi:hypothetical protein
MMIHTAADVLPANWPTIVSSVITALAGLVGVAVGGRIATHNLKEERRSARRLERLREFYAPLRGIRAEIAAKKKLNKWLHDSVLAERVKKEETEFATRRQISNQAREEYDSVIDYIGEQIPKEFAPAYRRMLELFRARMDLAEPSTIAYFPDLVEVVDLWNRPLSTAILKEIEPEDKKLLGLYEDIEHHFMRLSEELKKK